MIPQTYVHATSRMRDATLKPSETMKLARIGTLMRFCENNGVSSSCESELE
jgi:hypothetical protein